MEILIIDEIINNITKHSKYEDEVNDDTMSLWDWCHARKYSKHQ
jgi:hypothetical protein